MFLPFHILRYQSNKRIRKIYSWAQINFLSAKLNFIYYFQELIREGMDTQFNIYIFWFSKHLEYFSALICCVNLTDNNMTFKDIACNYEILKEMNTSYRASTKGLSTECISRAQIFSVERTKNNSNYLTKSDIFKLTSYCLCDAHYFVFFFLENEYFESAFSGRSHFAFYVLSVPYQ